VTGLAPVKAIPKALARAGLSAADVDLFEINEAFASMCVATVRQLGLDPDRVNVNGSGCSLGHPIAATGARMLVTLVHELRRRHVRGGRNGLGHRHRRSRTVKKAISHNELWLDCTVPSAPDPGRRRSSQRSATLSV
jgi:acetyl-CoA acetyltransferase